MNGISAGAGEYALFTIPGPDTWTIILSTQTNLWGSTGYTEENDVLRVKAPVIAGDFDENFTMSFESVNTEGGKLVLEWSNIEVEVDLGVDSDGESGKNVAKALADAKRAYRNAANYYSGQGDHEKALATIEIALQLDPDYWYTNWVKAKILYASGNTRAGLKQRWKAMTWAHRFLQSPLRKRNGRLEIIRFVTSLKNPASSGVSYYAEVILIFC